MAQQTGLDLPVVSLRLFPASTLLLVALQLCWAGKGHGQGMGRSAGRRPGASRRGPGLRSRKARAPRGPLLLEPVPEPESATRARAVPARRRGDRRPAGPAAAGTPLADRRPVGDSVVWLRRRKGLSPPGVHGRALVFAAWRRTVTRGWVLALALCAGAFVASYGLLYSGGRTASALDPFQSSFRSFPGRNLELEIGDHLTRASALPLATWVTVVALLVPLAGLAFARLSLRSPTVQQAWLLGLFVASLAAFLVVDLPGFSQLYFLWYGYTAAAVVRRRACRSGDKVARGPGPRPFGALVVGVVGGGLLALAPTGSGAPLVKAYMVVGALLGLVVVLAAAASRSARRFACRPCWRSRVAHGRAARRSPGPDAGHSLSRARRGRGGAPGG